jgi:hypothetical protein
MNRYVERDDGCTPHYRASAIACIRAFRAAHGFERGPVGSVRLWVDGEDTVFVFGTAR